jgi:transposase
VHTDANAIAGVLEELFVADATSADRRCHACGHEHPVGAHPLYEGAGHVLRCPSCGALAATIVERPDRLVVSMLGTWSVTRAR